MQRLPRRLGGPLAVSALVSSLTAGAAEAIPWEATGLSGGGGMFTPAISPADPNLMMLNCDMSAAYLSNDGGRNWSMIHHAQLRSDTRCRPAFHPTDANILFATSGGHLRVSRDAGTRSPRTQLRSHVGEIACKPDEPNVMPRGVSESDARTPSDAAKLGKCSGRLAGSRDSYWIAPGRAARFTRQPTGPLALGRPRGTLGWSGRKGCLGKIASLCRRSDKAAGVVMLYSAIRSKRGREFAGACTGLATAATRGNHDGSRSEHRHKGCRPVSPRGDRPVRALALHDAKPLTVYARTRHGFHPPTATPCIGATTGQSWRQLITRIPDVDRLTLRTTTSRASRGSCYRVAKLRSGRHLQHGARWGLPGPATSLTSRTTAGPQGSWGH